jgi:membrane-bound metal-dependent hydrolase YbcI (DUF457 family)
MADGVTHKLAGTGSGLIFAAYRANGQSPGDWIVELAGGAIGGYVGGILPDVLEPAISSWHRGTAHSYVSGATLATCVYRTLSDWETACRGQAQNCRAIRMSRTPGGTFVAASSGPLHQLLSSAAELFWRLLAGFLSGLVAGYVSHLALDATTPRSIPLIGSGT